MHFRKHYRELHYTFNHITHSDGAKQFYKVAEIPAMAASIPPAEVEAVHIVRTEFTNAATSS